VTGRCEEGEPHGSPSACSADADADARDGITPQERELPSALLTRHGYIGTTRSGTPSGRAEASGALPDLPGTTQIVVHEYVREATVTSGMRLLSVVIATFVDAEAASIGRSVLAETTARRIGPRVASDRLPEGSLGFLRDPADGDAGASLWMAAAIVRRGERLVYAQGVGDGPDAEAALCAIVTAAWDDRADLATFAGMLRIATIPLRGGAS